MAGRRKGSIWVKRRGDPNHIVEKWVLNFFLKGHLNHIVADGSIELNVSKQPENVQHITPAMHVIVQHAVRSGSSTMTNDKKPNHRHEHLTTTAFIKLYSPSLSATN